MADDLKFVIEGILFAAGEPMAVQRLAAVLAVPEQEVEEAAAQLAGEYTLAGRGIRLVRMGDLLQLCSAPELADRIRLALETRKPPQLSPASLEVLSVVAYFQPVTRAYIEQVRGVDSGYTVNLLADRGLIAPCGHLEKPGRPTLVATTPLFLRTFGLRSLEELPELPEAEEDEELRKKLEAALSAAGEANAAGEGETP